MLMPSGPLAEIEDSLGRRIVVFKELPEDAIPEKIKKEVKA
jgi:hypothetical protein